MNIKYVSMYLHGITRIYNIIIDWIYFWDSSYFPEDSKSVICIILYREKTKSYMKIEVNNTSFKKASKIALHGLDGWEIYSYSYIKV